LLLREPNVSQPGTKQPLFFLAFDSADAGLLERWVGQGYLPTLKGVLDRGVHSRLTGPELVSENGIWISLLSGLDRSQHGYYYWRPLRPGSYELELSDQRVDGAAPFWSHLRSGGMRIAAFDIPETHCVPELPGVQIANWAAHNQRFAGYSVPAPLFAELRDRFGPSPGFEERVPSTPDADERLYRGLLQQVRQKGEICRHLLEQGDFDLFAVGFHEAHIAGHQFWKYSGDAGNRPLRDATRDVYQAIDREFGELLARMPPDTTVVVVSNMGLQEDYPNLELTQAFCRELGYHRLQAGSSPWAALANLARRAIPAGWQRTVAGVLPDGFHARMLSREWLGGTDWSKTTVFPITAYFLGLLRVNLRGREPLGIVEPGPEYVQLLEQVERDLLALVDPVSGAPAVRHVARTIDLFDTGPHASLPDIFFDWAPAPYPKLSVAHPRAVLRQKDLFFNRDTRHDLCGFFAAAGPGIGARGRIGELSVLDVAPTCLRMLGQPAPPEMRGAVAANVFTT
jgi:predicted AlkP superfamily phosphohydrolase/phosphomutase